MFDTGLGNLLFFSLILFFFWLIGGFKFLGWLFERSEDRREGKIAKKIVGRDKRTQAQYDAENTSSKYSRLLELVLAIAIALIVIFIIFPLFKPM